RPRAEHAQTNQFAKKEQPASREKFPGGCATAKVQRRQLCAKRLSPGLCVHQPEKNSRRTNRLHRCGIREQPLQRPCARQAENVAGWHDTTPQNKLRPFTRLMGLRVSRENGGEGGIRTP